MKKMMIFVLALIVILGFMAIFNKRIKMMFFGEKDTAVVVQQQTDLEIINDTKDSISSQYKKELGKDSVVAKPSEVLPGGKGFVSVQTANKTGYYEIRYTFPRPANKPSRIALSQLIAAVEGKPMETSGAVRVATGNVDDIFVSYEEVVQ